MAHHRKPKKWMQHLDLKKGALTRQAHREGESTQEFAQQHKHSPGKTGRRARLALVFKKAGKKRTHRSARR